MPEEGKRTEYTLHSILYIYIFVLCKAVFAVRAESGGGETA